MKVEYTDVSVTEKSLVVEIPTEVVEEQNPARHARLRAHVEAAGLPAGEGAGQGRPPALHAADPAGRGRRPDSARRRRRAARARGGAGRHAEREGRLDRRAPAAEVHGGHRHGAAGRSGPARRDPAAQAAGQRAGRGSDVDDRAPALGSGALRAGRGTRRRARRDGRRRHDAAQARQGRRGSGGAGGAPGCQHRDWGGRQPAGVRRGSDGPRGRGRQDVHHQLPGRVPGGIAGRGQRAVRADRDRGEVEGAARPRRRVRQGSGLRLAGRAAGVREGAADARGGAEPGPRRCARIS